MDGLTRGVIDTSPPVLINRVIFKFCKTKEQVNIVVLKRFRFEVMKTMNNLKKRVLGVRTTNPNELFKAFS